jgi:hypothetical protein
MEHITNKKPEKDHLVFRARKYKDWSIGSSVETDSSFVHASQLFHKPKNYRAPTLSWAAVDGEIDFHGLPKPCACIESVILDIPAETPCGRLKHACLAIYGPLRRA